MEELAFPLLSPTDEVSLEARLSLSGNEATVLIRPEASELTFCNLFGSGSTGPLSLLTVNGELSLLSTTMGENPVGGPGPAIVYTVMLTIGFYKILYQTKYIPMAQLI